MCSLNPRLSALDPSLAENECVALFLARARAVGSGLEPSERTLPVIAAICRRLDGLPLAIELNRTIGK